MGANCCGAQSKAAMQSSTLIDLPETKPSNPEDKLDCWELQTPLARTAFKAYLSQLDEAHKASGGQGSVELGQLVQKFSTPVWSQALKSNDTEFMQFLTTQIPAGPDSVDYQSLVMLGLLHCKDRKQPTEKADAFYGLL